MKFKPCDELGANIIEAQIRWKCTLDYPTVVWLIEEIERRYDPQLEDFDTTLENALRARDLEENVEWHAYKMAVGQFFGNRARYKRAEV